MSIPQSEGLPQNEGLQIDFAAKPWHILTGDVLEILKQLPDESVHVVITSPPYWGGLRDYGTGRWEGGSPACDHVDPSRRLSIAASTLGDNGKMHGSACRTYHHTCQRCGAVRVDQQFGLEKVPDCLGWATGQPCGECYICRMVAVFREVGRVLRPDGTLWINMGDTAAGSWGNYGANRQLRSKQKPEYKRRGYDGWNGLRPSAHPGPGLKPKDRIGIPWRMVFALQADGWYFRTEIIWHKTSNLPESVQDRPARNHEYIFLFAKSKRYFYDREAVKTPIKESSLRRLGRTVGRQAPTFMGNKHSSPWDPQEAGANLRTVWSIAPAGFRGAHFAVFPKELPRRIIKAATSEKGCCPQCGKPWLRICEKKFVRQQDVSPEKAIKGAPGQKPTYFKNGWDGFPRGKTIWHTTDWRPGCDCDAGEPVPCVVLDPFAGAGTTLLVARRLGRYALGVELNPEYVKLAEERIQADTQERIAEIGVKDIEEAKTEGISGPVQLKFEVAS